MVCDPSTMDGACLALMDKITYNQRAKILLKGLQSTFKRDIGLQFFSCLVLCQGSTCCFPLQPPEEALTRVLTTHTCLHLDYNHHLISICSLSSVFSLAAHHSSLHTAKSCLHCINSESVIPLPVSVN